MIATHPLPEYRTQPRTQRPAHRRTQQRTDWATLPLVGTLLALPAAGTLLLMLAATRAPCATAACPEAPAPLLLVLTALNLLMPAALWSWPRCRAFEPARRTAFAGAMLLAAASVFGPVLL